MEKYTYMSGMKAGMILCLQGECDALINGQLYKIKRGVLCFVSPLISFYEMSRNDDFRYVEIMENVEVLYSTFKKIYNIIINLRVWHFPCLHLDELHIKLFLERKRWIDAKRAARQKAFCEEEAMLLDQMCYLMEREIMMEFIHLYFTNNKVAPQTVRKNELKVFRFISSLQMHYKTERSVAYYAGESCLSVGYFARIVREYTGKTPSEWISFITILNAKAMLEQSEMSIKDIARELHFPEQFTFRKYFKQYAGVSPSGYRIAAKKSKSDVFCCKFQ